METTKQFVLFELLKSNSNWISGDYLAKKRNISRESIWKAINSLKNKGIIIESRKNLGYKYIKSSYLDCDIINFYSDMKFENSLFVFNSVTSTQKLAKEYLIKNTIENSTIFISNSQTEGYGRRGCSFYSPSMTGLYFSIILPNVDYQSLQSGLITASTAVSVTKILEKFYINKEFKLKWVNDIYLENHKVGGIITEANFDLESGVTGHHVIGVGLNLSTKEFPEDLWETANGIDYQLEIDRNKIAAELIQEIINNFYDYNNSKIIEEYRKKSFLTGKFITLKLGNKIIKGQVQEISNNGNIVITKESGEVQSFESGEVIQVGWRTE